MSGPAHDLSKLRINRDPPPEVRRAFGRTLLIMGVVLAAAAAAFFVVRSCLVATVDAMVVEGGSAGGGAAAPGATAVTANGYVVARTRASVSAKIPGRLAALPVDGGSVVRKGEVIARLDNADYEAAVSEQQANLATSQAQLIEAESERDQSQREYNRVKDIRGSNPSLV